MNTLIAAILLAATPQPASAAQTLRSPVTDVVEATAPAIPTAAPEFSVTNAAVPVGFIALLGLAAFYMRRRREGAGKLVQVLEVTNLGPKRSLVLARLGNQTLLIGASEAGLQTLSTQPISDEMLAVADAQAMRQTRSRRREIDATPTPPFENLLGEVTEDQELRRKLALGISGKIQ